MTDGLINASPSAAARTASINSWAPASLSRKPRRPGLQRAVHVLVEVERRDDDDGQRVGHPRSRQGLGGVEPVHLRHPDVEQAHVGPQVPGSLDRLAAVGHLGDHLDVGLGVEDHGEPAAHQLLVVGDQHPDRHDATPSSGMVAWTAPAVRRPRPGVEGASEEVGRSAVHDEPESRRRMCCGHLAAPVVVDDQLHVAMIGDRG